MKRKTLTSKAVIAGLVVSGLSAMSAYHATAADVTWDWAAAPQIWDINHTAAWVGGNTFQDGQSVEFLSGGGYSGKVSIWEPVSVASIAVTNSVTDVYTFAGDTITASGGGGHTLTIDGSLTLNTRLYGADSTISIIKAGAGVLNLNAENVFGSAILDIQNGSVVAADRALYGSVGLKMAASTTLLLGEGNHRVNFYTKDAVVAAGASIKPKSNENAILRIYNAVGTSDGNIIDFQKIDLSDNGTGKLTLIILGDPTTDSDRQFRFDSTKANTYTGGTYLVGNTDIRTTAGGPTGSTTGYQTALGFGTGPIYLENKRTYITWSNGALRIENDIHIESQIDSRNRTGFYIRGQDGFGDSEYGAHVVLAGKFVIEKNNIFFIDNDKSKLAAIGFQPKSGVHATLSEAITRAKQAYRTEGWLELNNAQSSLVLASASILDGNGYLQIGAIKNLPATVFTDAPPNIRVSSNNGSLKLKQTAAKASDTQFASNVRLITGTLTVSISDTPNDGASYQMIEYTGVIDGNGGVLLHDSGGTQNFDKYMRLNGDGYGAGGIYQTGNVLIRSNRSNSVRLGNNNMLGNTNATIGLWDDATRYESVTNGNSGPRVHFNWSGDMLLNMNVTKIERDVNLDMIMKSGGAGTLIVARPIMLNAAGKNSIAIDANSGSMIFGYGKKYASPFDYTSLYTKKADGSMDVVTMSLAGALKISAGSSLVLDYIAQDSDNNVTVVNRVQGAGDFVAGGYRLDARQGDLTGNYTIDNSTSAPADFTGKTLVNANTRLVISGDRFKSKDITVAESGTMESAYGTDLTAFKNRGTYSGDITLASAATFSNTGTVAGNVTASGIILSGIGSISGDATLAGAVGSVNSGLGGTVSVGSMTLDSASSLVFRAGESIAVSGAATLGNAAINLVAGKGGFSGSYNLITGGTVSGNFVLGPNYRAGVLSVSGKTVSVGTITDTTLTSPSDWDFVTFRNSDNVTFNGAGSTVAVALAGVYANKINIDVNGYAFTGGSVAGALYVKDNNAVSFSNSAVNFGYLNLGAGSVTTLSLASDIVLKSEIEGSGTLEIAGTKQVQWNVTDTNFTGKIKLSGGVLDLINTTGATIELAGGTLTSTSKARVGSAITFAPNTVSIIDLGGAAYQTGTYKKWTNSITGADGTGVKLTLMNGALDNTAGKIIGDGSNAEASTQTLGEVLKISDLTLADAWINRPISPAATGGKISVISPRTVKSASDTDHVSHSVLDTYATIDLSNNGTLEVGVAKYSELIAFNFLIGDGTLKKTGAGLMKFFRIDTAYHGSGAHTSMHFDGTIDVSGGTLEFIRNMGQETVDSVSGAPFVGDVNNPTKAKIIVNNSGVLYANGAYSLGSVVGGIPEVTVNTGGKIMLNGENVLIEKLTLSGGYVTAMIEAFDAIYNNSIGAVKDGVSTLNVNGGVTSEIATQKFSATQGDWDITVDTGSTLLITAKLEGDNGRTFIFGGAGKSIIPEGVVNNLAGSTVKVKSGSTLQVGYADKLRARGDLGTATVIAEGTLDYYRNGDYDFLVNLEGNGTLNKFRDWTMTIKTANNFAGLLSVNAGTVVLSSGSSAHINSDIIVKNKAYLDVSSFTGGYVLEKSSGGNSDGSTWDKLTQGLVLETGGTVKGMMIAGDGGIVSGNGGYVDSLKVDAGGSIGGENFNSKTESARIDLTGGTWVVGKMADPISGTAVAASIDTVTVKGHINLSGGSKLLIDIDSSAQTADKIDYTGKLTLAASEANRINLVMKDMAVSYTDGKTYTLFTGKNNYTATDLAKWFKSGRATLDFSPSTATSIVVTVTGGGPETVTWNGADNAVWKNNDDTKKTWKLPSSADTFFLNDDTTIFDTTAAGSNVKIDVAGVTAKAATVQGKDYTFSADGKITVTNALTIDGAKATFNGAEKHSFGSVALLNSGTLNLSVSDGQTFTPAYVIGGVGNLEKSGTGTLDLATTANTYTGTTTVTGGILKVDALGNIGGASAGGIILNGGSLEVVTNDLNFGTRTIGTGSAGGSIVSDKNLTATLGTLAGKLTKSGSGDLTIQDSYTANKEISIAGGKLLAKSANLTVLSGSGTFDASNTALKVQGGSFGGTLANVSSLEVGVVDSAATNNTFTYMNSAGITVSTKVGDHSSLVADNITLGVGSSLEAGYVASETDPAKKKGDITGNIVLTGANLNIADNNPSGNGTVGILNVTGNVTLNAAKWNVSVDIPGKKVDKLVVSGTLTLNGVSDLNLKQDGAWNENDVYVVAEYATLAGATTPNDIKNALVVKGLTRKEIIYMNSGTQLSFKIAAQSATWLWDNGEGTMQWNCYQDATNHGDGNWDDQGEFYDPPYFVAGENVIFKNAGTGSITVDGDKAAAGNQGVSANKMTFENTSGNDFTFTGGAITANQVYINGTGTVNFSNAGNVITEKLYLDNGKVILGVDDALSGSIKFDGATGATLELASGTENTLNQLEGIGKGIVDLKSGSTLNVKTGQLSDGAKIKGGSDTVFSKTGAATDQLLLSGINTTDFTGTLSAQSGILNLAGTNDVLNFTGASGAKVIVSGTLGLGNGSSEADLSGNGALTIKGAFDLGGNNTVFGGSMVIDTASVTTLTGSNAIKGLSSIEVKGTLDLNGNNASATTVNTASGSTLKLTNGAEFTVSGGTLAGDITDDGTLIKIGSGAVTLSGNSNYGSLIINGGSVNVASGANLGAASVTINNSSTLSATDNMVASGTGLVLGSGTAVVTVASGKTAEFGDLSGSSALKKSDGGELILSGDNSGFSGSVIIDAGTLTTQNAITVNDLSGSGTWNLAGDATVNKTGSTGSTFSGTLSGSGSFNKTGSGKFTLSQGNDAYTGAINVTEGTLIVDGSFKGSDLNVSTATFGGTSAFKTANFGTDAVFLANLTGGGANFNSNTLTTDGLLNVASLTLDVSGVVNLATADSYKILLMDSGSLNVDWNNVSIGNVFTNNYQFSLIEEGNQLYLSMEVVRPEYYKSAQGPNELAVADYFDAGWGGSDNFWKATVANEFIGIAATDPGAASAFLEQASGYSIAHATQSREMAGEHFRQLWSQRLTTGKAAQPSLETVNVNAVEGYTIDFRNPTDKMKETYWAQPFTYYNKSKDESYVNGYDYQANGITGGFDSRWDTGMVVGAAFFYEDGRVETNKSSDKTNINDTRFAVYGGLDGENASLIVSANYGLQNYEGKRNVTLGTLGGVSRSDYDGNTWGASIDASAKMIDSVRLFVGFDWMNIRRDAFQEDGSDFALDVKSESYDTYASRLGVRYDEYFSNTFGVYGLLAWKHRFDDTESDVTAAYSGVPGEFTAHGLSNSPDSILIGVGIEYNILPNYSVFADVNSDLNADRTEFGGSAGLRYSW